MAYLDRSYANYSAEQCFGLTPSEAQVACSAQHLNITDPPSEYSFEEYPFLWEPITCMLANVTYSHRIDVPDNFNWCSVPLKGSDAFLFASIALVIAGCLFGKLSAVWVLVAGGVIGTINNYANLLQVSNGIAIWLGISPPDLFFYAFLPPLLVDSAIRIDYFMFSKLWIHILMMAFVMVILSAIILTPLLLFVLNFQARGFTWVHGALFAAMIASTDALAATAILKQGGGPEKLVVLMEGEALLNDASAITLFEVFMHLLEEHPGAHDVPTVWSAIPTIIVDIIKLASIGAGVGLAMSIATGYLLRWLRWRGAKPAVETTIVLAVAYLAFYVGQSPAQGSGVISVVVYGLWGNYTSKWGMLASTEESGSFDAFWDTLSFASNGLVFFWAGVASINYFIRSIDILGGNAWSYAAIPLIYLFMMAIRTGTLALFNVSIFVWIRERLSWAEVTFTGWCGLRGAISLIMTADFIAHSAFLQGDLDIDRVNSDISIWTASFVVLTLVINAPSVSVVMRWLRLDRIPLEKQAMRAKAKRALLRFTGAAIETLREDDEEFLQGANWEAVAQYVDVSNALKKFDPPPPPPGAGGGVTVTVAPAQDGGKHDSVGGGEAVVAGKGSEPSIPKSLVRGVSTALLLPLSPFLGTVREHAADGGAETGNETDASVSRRGRLRKTIFGQSPVTGMGKTTADARQRIGRQRRRRRRRTDAAGRPFTSGAGFASDGSDSELEESDTSLSSDDTRSPARSDDFLLDSESDADQLVEEVVEECPFIQAAPRPAPLPRKRRESSDGGEAKKDVSPAPDEQQDDIELGLGPGAPTEPANMTPATYVASQPSPDSATTHGDAPSRQQQAGGASTSSTKQAAGSPETPATAEPAGAEAEEDALSAEYAAFVRRQQRSQRQRPALGSLFAAGAEGGPEQHSPQSPRSAHGEQQVTPAHGAEQLSLASGESPRAGLSNTSFHRVGSLQPITENVQQVPEEQQGWHQQPSLQPSAAPSEAGGDPEVAYYSSLPAALGQQLRRQLQQELSAGASASAEGVAEAESSKPDRPTDELRYYSSVPAASGRQLARQLQQELAQAPGDASADAELGSHTGQPPESLPPASPTVASVTTPAADAPGYYSSLPAAVGRQLGAQLRQEMAAAQGWAASGTPAATRAAETASQGGQEQPPGAGAEPSPGYYSSLPAAVGRRLSEQLRKERMGEAAEGAAGEQTQQQQAQVTQAAVPQPAAPEADAAYYSSLPSQVGRTLHRQLQQQLAAVPGPAAATDLRRMQAGPPREEIEPATEVPSDAEATSAYYSTMPAAVGRSVQRQLAQQMSLEQSSDASVGGASRAGSLEPGGDLTGRPPRKPFGLLRRPPRPGGVKPSSSNESLSQQPAAAAAAVAGLHTSPHRSVKPSRLAQASPSPRGPAWEDYHRTVTGAAGPSLQAELQRQLAQRRTAAAASSATAAGQLAALPQYDLLGRKLPASTPSLNLASSGSGALPESVTPGSDFLRRGSQSARGPGHSRTPSGDAASRHPAKPWTAAAVLPTATPVAAHLQLRRARTLDRSRRSMDQRSVGSASRRSMDASAGPPSFALPLPLLDLAEAGEAGAAAGSHLHRRREEVHGALTRRSGSARSHDTSWQHQPQLLRSLSRPGLASLAASVEERGSEGEGDAPSPETSMRDGHTAIAIPATPLVFSGAVPPSPRFEDAFSRKPGKGVPALQRYSLAGSAGSGSLHAGSAYATALAAARGSPTYKHSDSNATQGSGMTAAVLGEMRSRLIAGLKRYFHAKRMEGLLSSQGMRILDYACDFAAEHSHSPLGMWALLEREVAGNLSTRAMARTLMAVARGWRSSPRLVQTATAWPVRKFTGFLRRLLGRRMLVSCEVAVEYYLSLIHSPQIQWLQQSDEAWPLQAELEAEVDAAYRFIIDREIEAPDRFQAIQSYRAAMAVLRQQLTFVHELFESGMVDEGEKDDMAAPLDKRVRHLEITGPVWRPPRPRTVLRGLPFMQAVPEELFRAILAAGTIREYKTGVTFWASSDLVARTQGEAGPGAFVVLSGVIRRTHQRPDGSVKEYFQGIGGVVGALLAMTGTRLPGSEAAVAEGNTLGKGPVLFHVPQSAVHLVQRRAAEGDPACVLLRLQLLRLAAAFVTESCESDVVAAVQLHLMRLAAAKAQRQLKRKTARAGSAGLDAPASPRAGFPVQPAAAAEEPQSQRQSSAGAPLQPSLSQPLPSIGSGELGLPTLSRRLSGLGSGGSEPHPRSSAGLRRTSSLARLSSWQRREGSAAAAAAAASGDESADAAPQLRPSSGGGLRHSKSFGGQLADLMHQIAREEFEDLEADAPEPRQRSVKTLSQVEEALEEGDLSSPKPSDAASSLPAGASAADLAALSEAAAAGGSPTARGLQQQQAQAQGAENGHAERQASQTLGRQKSAEQEGTPAGYGSGAAAASAAKAASKALRSRARAAERRAPQYAAEILADLRRGLPTGLLLELPPGAAFGQTTHAILLRGGLTSGSADPPSSSPLASLRQSFAVGASGDPALEEGMAAAVAAATAPHAPRILPWLWSARYRCNAASGPAGGGGTADGGTDKGGTASGTGAKSTAWKLPTEQQWRAGPGGALLLVCLDEDGEIPPGVLAAEAAMGDAALAAEAAAAAAASREDGLQSHPLDLGSSGSLRQQAEHVAAGAAAAARGLGRVATFAATPATRATSGLLRIMPFPHRHSRSNSLAGPGEGESSVASGATAQSGGSGGAGEGGSSQRGMQHGVSPVTVERLTPVASPLSAAVQDL